MDILILGITAYLALLATVLVHEFGHRGKKIIIVRWFPWVEGKSLEAKYQYGGLVANFIAALIIYLWKPESLFLQLFGFFNMVHLILYLIFGSFNKEIDYPPRMWKYVVFDDVENDYWFIFVPLGFLIFWYFKGYYLPVIINIFGGLM